METTNEMWGWLLSFHEHYLPFDYEMWDKILVVKVEQLSENEGRKG